jgi:biotin carboxyl carrier protein
MPGRRLRSARFSALAAAAAAHPFERRPTMAQEVRAPLAGNILEVLVETGAKVQEDDDLLIIEALKMENAIAAPCSGTISEIRVKKGDKVGEDAVLMIIG